MILWLLLSLGIVLVVVSKAASYTKRDWRLDASMVLAEKIMQLGFHLGLALISVAVFGMVDAAMVQGLCIGCIAIFGAWAATDGVMTVSLFDDWLKARRRSTI